MADWDTSRWAAGDPNGVFAARVRAPVEPPVAADDLEAGTLEQLAPLVIREPREHEARLAGFAAHRQRQRALLRVPVGTLEDPWLALEPAAVRVGDVARTRGEDVEHEPSAGEEQLARCSERTQARVVVEQVQEGAKRTGDERDPLLDRRRLELAQSQVEQIAHARQLRAAAADLEHPRRGVDCDHAYAGRGGRHRDPTRAHRELDDR